jgi:hypothetical protein
MAKITAATPTEERCVTSYPVRRSYAPGVVYPPEITTVADTIDIHCHAHANQQDALALAKYASQSGMKGILYKTITGRSDPAGAVREIDDQLRRWADDEGVTPILCWSGALMSMDNSPPTAAFVNAQIDAGVTGLWLPVFNHANTLNRVGGKPIWWDPDADPADHTKPLPWNEALRFGHYLLDDAGALKDEVREIVRIVHDRDVALFFGHATHKEIFLLAEEVARLGYTRAVIDHPFSPFVDLEIDQMQELAGIGITLNFTFDELSPLLGVDPARMYAAIRAVGPEHCTLSSDAGEPLFPNSVECMRLIRGYMEAFGLNQDELYQVCTVNPAKVVGLN